LVSVANRLQKLMKNRSLRFSPDCSGYAIFAAQALRRSNCIWTESGT